MKTSRVAVFHGKDRPFTLETVLVPELRRGEILVRNEYTTLCRSDLNTFVGKRVEKTPTILGHEIVGRIEARGPEAPIRDLRDAELRVGDRITWAIYASDPASALARAGMPQKGEGLFKYGHERISAESHLHGGLSEYCILRQHTPVVRVDAPIPLPVLAIINCAVATVAGALRVAGGVGGRNVLVAGAGMLGIVACAMARVAGAKRVVALDVDDARLAVATRFGVDGGLKLEPGLGFPIDRLTTMFNGEPIALALDFSGSPETMEALLTALGIGGVLVLVGATYPQRPLQLSAEHIVRNLLTVKGLHNYNDKDLVAAVEFMERYHARFPFADLVQDGFSLEEVDAAFDCGVTAGMHRVGIRFPRH